MSNPQYGHCQFSPGWTISQPFGAARVHVKFRAAATVLLNMDRCSASRRAVLVRWHRRQCNVTGKTSNRPARSGCTSTPSPCLQFDASSGCSFLRARTDAPLSRSFWSIPVPCPVRPGCDACSGRRRLRRKSKAALCRGAQRSSQIFRLAACRRIGSGDNRSNGHTNRRRSLVVSATSSFNNKIYLS